MRALPSAPQISRAFLLTLTNMDVHQCQTRYGNAHSDDSNAKENEVKVRANGPAISPLYVTIE